MKQTKTVKVGFFLIFLVAEFFGFGANAQAVIYRQVSGVPECGATVSFGVANRVSQGPTFISITGSVKAVEVLYGHLLDLTAQPGTNPDRAVCKVPGRDEVVDKFAVVIANADNPSEEYSRFWVTPLGDSGGRPQPLDISQTNIKVPAAATKFTALVKIQTKNNDFLQLTASAPVTYTAPPPALTNGQECVNDSDCQSNNCPSAAMGHDVCVPRLAGTGQPTHPGGQQQSNPAGQQPSNPGGQQPSVPTAPCTDPNSCLYNPLPEEELTHTFLVIMQGFLGIVAIWAVIFIIVGGFQLVMSAGNEEAILKGKKTITWALLGLVFALLSFSIVAIVQNLLKATIKPTNSTSYYSQNVKLV